MGFLEKGGVFACYWQTSSMTAFRASRLAAPAVPGFARSWSRWRTLATQTVDASLGRVLIVSAGLLGAVRREEGLFGCSSVQAAARQSNPTATASLLRIQTPMGRRSK